MAIRLREMIRRMNEPTMTIRQVCVMVTLMFAVVPYTILTLLALSGEGRDVLVFAIIYTAMLIPAAISFIRMVRNERKKDTE